MAKQNDKLGNKLLALGDEDIMQHIPDISELQIPLSNTTSPLETPVSQNTMNPAGFGNISSGDAQIGTQQNQNTQTDPPVKQIESGDVKIGIAEPTNLHAQSQNNMYQPGVDISHIKQPTYNDPMGQNIFGDDVPPAGSGGGNMGGGGSGGGSTNTGASLPASGAEGNNKDLAGTLVDLFDHYILGYTRDKAEISIPDIFGRLLKENVRTDVRKKTIGHVNEYNAVVKKELAMTHDEESALYDAFYNALKDNDKLAKFLTPEVQAILVAGTIFKEKAKDSARLQQAGKELLRNISNEIKNAPKEPGAQNN